MSKFYFKMLSSLENTAMWMLITAIFTLTVLSIFWVIFLISRNAQFTELSETSTKALPWITWDLTVSSDSQPYLIRSLLSDLFRGADRVSSPAPKFSYKALWTRRTCSLLQNSSFLQQASTCCNWLLVWTSKTSFPQDHGCWTDS